MVEALISFMLQLRFRSQPGSSVQFKLQLDRSLIAVCDSNRSLIAQAGESRLQLLLTERPMVMIYVSPTLRL